MASLNDGKRSGFLKHIKGLLVANGRVAGKRIEQLQGAASLFNIARGDLVDKLRAKISQGIAPGYC